MSNDAALAGAGKPGSQVALAAGPPQAALAAAGPELQAIEPEPEPGIGR
jgi:hypothetical protein